MCGRILLSFIFHLYPYLSMNSISRHALLSCLLGLGLAMPQDVVAQTTTPGSETFVLLRDGRLRVFDDAILLRTDTVAGQVQFHLAPQGQTTAAQVVRFDLKDVVSLTAALPTEVKLPRFAAYKVTTKANANVAKEAVGKIAADGNTVSLSIAAIDRTVRPTFALDKADADRGVAVYVADKRQQSEVNWVHFGAPVPYLLADPNHERITQVETAAAIPPRPAGNTEKATRLDLTAAMLSSNYASPWANEALANLVDGNPGTYFHTVWGEGLDESVVPYVDIVLPEALKTFKFDYLTRASSTNNMPSVFTLLTSTDGMTWSELHTFTETDGVPQSGAAQRFQSNTLTAATPFTHLRLRCDKSTRRNYLVLAELNLYAVEQVAVPATPGTPATYTLKTLPYGRTVSVTADFPARKADRVPRIDITLKDGVTVQDIHNNKSKYRRADIAIDGVGVWSNLKDSVSIKGRGNSTWGMYKKPYRLKFAKGVKPFGLHKGKSWVLLANALGDQSTGGGAHLNNAIAMKTAQIVGTAAVNHIIPVDLYINGDYMGAYSFTEQVGISGNSVDLPNDSTAALLELDTYEQDGDPFFYDTTYNLRTKYKDPEPKDYLKDFGKEAHDHFYATLHSEFHTFTEAVKAGDYDHLIDIPSLVRYFMVNDLIGNLEFGHPKSTYLHRSDIFDASTRWTFGPVWDCDWAYGYEHSGEFGIASPEFDVFQVAPAGHGRALFKQLLQSSEEVRRQYYLLWNDFVNNGGLDALTHYIDDYQQFVQPSLTLDYNRHHRGPSDYAGMAARLKTWLSRRAHYIFDHLEVFPDTPTGLETVLAPDPVAPMPPKAVRRGIFTLTGQRITTPRHALQSGLYIIDGRKVVVK